MYLQIDYEHIYQRKTIVFVLYVGITTHEVTTPSPKAGEILIQVAASSVNPCDVVRALAIHYLLSY